MSADLRAEPQDKLVLACAGCSTANRVPVARLAENPQCGKCGALLLDGKPVVLDEAKIDTERAQNIAARFAIRSIPTMILFRNGREAARVSGAMDARAIKAWLGAKISG